MIHQLIFASPKPGMTEAEFQRYWLEVHAIQYASKIPQILRYKVDMRLDSAAESKFRLGSGVAEIWLENEEEQLASLQTPEFLQGARLDEPRWAAFWRTIVLDTTAHTVLEGPPPTRDATLVKMFVLFKRKPGMSVEEFRTYSLDEYAPHVLQLPGLRRYVQCHARDGMYAVGEPLLDGAAMLWFDDVAAVERAAFSEAERTIITPCAMNFADPKYLHRLVTREHWIIGPELRQPTALRMAS